MKIQLGRKFWIAATALIILFTVFIVGRNALHALKIKRQIKVLTRESEYYRAEIERDSLLLERLRYDDYLEEYAREHYRMQRRDEHVYIMED
ncbi:MAG TPA: septum formation initiator family protein [Candidatus Alistipes faecavium]|uniref:FtsB family cell division protein n=1 Tax=uncultured Alistipes sp. TaxID=538949 RepID=UPI001F92E36B|nr:septum formation initiator family protein [uncultured Alistipes sp.]HJA97601.1 septum formation initiator family protein [Candidatus Alistipes faecavium]